VSHSVETAHKRSGTPQFDATNIPADQWAAKAGSNSLTVTNNGFANYQHCNYKECDWVFEIFWTGMKTKEKFNGTVSPAPELVHGGEFVWGKFGIGIGIPDEDGTYVEIAW
jgi:hypothetical protein